MPYSQFHLAELSFPNFHGLLFLSAPRYQRRRSTSEVSSSSAEDSSASSGSEFSGDDSLNESTVRESPQEGNSQDSNSSGKLDTPLSNLRDAKEIAKPPKAPKLKTVSERSRIYVLTTLMFKEHPIIRAYATGPKNPVNNPHRWYCRMCHKNYSLKTRGGSSIVKHHRSRRHFRRDQRYRDAQSMPVYNRAGLIVTGDALEEEREEFSKIRNVPLVDSKRLLIGQTSIPLAGDDVGINTILSSQMLLFHDFLAHKVPLPLLPRVWGKFGVATSHSNLVANYCWEPSHVFVSCIY